jgi:ketosteroid isomerase-like protein
MLRIRNGKIQEYYEYMDTSPVEKIFGALVNQDKRGS